MKKIVLVAVLLAGTALLNGYVKDVGKAPSTSISFQYAHGVTGFAGDDFPGETKEARPGMAFGMTFGFPLNREVLRLEIGFEYERKGVNLTGPFSTPGHAYEFKYITGTLNIAFEYPSGFLFSTGLYFSHRLKALQKSDGMEDMDMEAVIESGDIGFNMKMAYRIPLSRKVFLAPYIRGTIGLYNVWYSDFSQHNATVLGGLEIGFRP